MTGPPEHRALCPECGRLATREITHRRGHTMTANYDCDRGHIWSTRWPVTERKATDDLVQGR